MVGQLFIIASDKTQIEVGETVHFSISYDENRTPENDIDIYINNDFLESIPVGPSPVLFNYTFEEDGIFYLYATTVGTPESNTIAINVDEATPQTQSNSVSWIINNKIVSSLEMNNKEIQSIVTSDNVVLYNINSSEYDAISLSSDKNILSYADSESCTLSAQLTDNQSSVAIEDETVTFTIYDANDDSIITSLIGNTDSTGLADVFYSSNGIGDIYVKASVGNIISSEVYIEDCTYWNETETTRITNGSTIYDNDMSVALPSKCEISFDECSIKSGSGGQHRFFLLPKSQYRSNIAQPQSAIYFDNETNNNVHTFGKRENDSTIEFIRESDSLGSYHTIKYIVDGTTVQMYFDDALKTTQTLSWISNYSDYCLSMIRWSADGISKIKNVKIKPLTRPFNNISLTSDENILSYADGDTCTLTAQLTKNGSPSLIEGETVSFYNGATLLGTDDTDSNGIATLTYTSAGIGDINVSAEVEDITSNTVSIEDCIRYDNATSDKTSNYSRRNLNTFTFNSEHYEAYRSVGTSLTSTFYSPIYADDTLPSDFEMSVMYKASNMNSELIEFIIASTHPTTYNGATELGLVVTDARRGLFHRVSGSATWYTESSTLSNDAWYTFYLKVEGTTVTGTILDSNDDIVYTSTQTISAVQNYKKWSIINGGNSRTLFFKNLKIKPL